MNPDSLSADFQILRFEDVSRHFGRRRALAHVSLECRAGEIVGLLGPNGAGKSTLLAIAATLMNPSAGSVRYGAVTAREGGAALRARIGLLAHDLHLYPELTALENLEFFARLYLLPDARRRAEAALERAGLGARGGELVSAFSRGQRQRLALERALVHEPRLVLLDEPFTGLDDEASRALVGRLAALREAGAIVLLATHDLETVERLVDHVAVLREGRLLALEAGPGALRERYRKLM
ncbi:MAG TPA: ABC transporter ATP-binding protein [Vicinamibacterales bacterium]|nr:ABC transporter ATP-binding protein [Vicinamibacterales bacterium]